MRGEGAGTAATNPERLRTSAALWRGRKLAVAVVEGGLLLLVTQRKGCETWSELRETTVVVVLAGLRPAQCTEINADLSESRCCAGSASWCNEKGRSWSKRDLGGLWFSSAEGWERRAEFKCTLQNVCVWFEVFQGQAEGKTPIKHLYKFLCLWAISIWGSAINTM